MSYVKRRIDLTIKLAEGTFDGASDTVTLTGLRVKAELTAAGGNYQSTLNCQIFGLPLDMMNRLTRIGPVNSVNPLNTVELAAGNDGEALTHLFTGQIIQSWADFSAMPDVSLNVVAFPTASAALKPVQALSYTGPTDVAEIMRTIANNMGIGFENHGVKVILSSPYFSGTSLDQLQSCAQAANIDFTVDGETLAIWPLYGYRNGPIPVISASTGMVGYPAYSSTGVLVTTEFMPGIRRGGQIKVESSLTPARGLWNVSSILHELECETPGGAWFTQVQGIPTDSTTLAQGN